MSDSRVTAAGWVLCALATLLAALTPSAAQEDTDDDAFVRQLYSGAALMYSLPALTLVYPAGPGEDRELNRISAERRAAYLRGRHATETRVVADVDFSSEHHDDNLLVIGWNNRLLERADGFEQDAEGWNFVGVEHGYDRDLLFEWYSPYNPEREFVFWSRIDPELDRYLQLPFFGSDWVVFDAYFVERFGRFDKDRPTWPPVRNEDLEVDNRPRRLKQLLAGTSKH